MKKLFSFLALSTIALSSNAQNIQQLIDQKAKALLPKVIEWRRHLHQNPELSNREFKTMEYIAAHLKTLGLEVKTGVAKTGVVALLKGGKLGPVVALRADIDALPVFERTNVPYKSTVIADYLGQLVEQGQRIAILAFGTLLYPALEAAEALNATVVNMRWAKPIDEALLREVAQSHDALVTLEDGAIMGGAGSAVTEALNGAGVIRPVLQLGLPDVFIEHGDPAKLMSLQGLDAAGIEHAIRQRFLLG